MVKVNGFPAVTFAGAVIEKCVAGPPPLVREKLTGVSGLELAVTLYGPPTVEFAVNGAAAIPDEFVTTAIVCVLFEN